MNENMKENQSNQEKNAGKISGWIPVVILFLLLATCWFLVFTQGLIGEISWYCLQLVVPIIGFVFFVVAVIKLIRYRKGTIRQWFILACSILAIFPALFLFKPVRYPYFLANTQPSATVRLPANVPLQVIWGGDKIKNNYHVFSPDQRWAYDFVAEPYLSGSTQLEDYGCYGTSVITPINGTIIAVHDGEPDEVPGASSNNIEQPRGNYVVIQMDTNTYLVLAHFIPGSIKVQVGDKVKEGQVLASCGNSGNTSEPHIHIHHQRINPEEIINGFGEGLPLYFRDQDGAAMPEGGIEVIDDKVVPLGPVVTHTGN